MKRKKAMVTAVLLSGSMGLGAPSLFAQAEPGPTVPRPGQPRQTQPTIPGQPAPGLPQTEPVPGGPGTIPERVQPDAGNMVISADDIKKAQEALKVRGMDPGPANGQMGPKTQEALSQFQKANNLPATGVLDEKTADKLGVGLKGDKDSVSPGAKDNSIPSPQKSMPNSR